MTICPRCLTDKPDDGFYRRPAKGGDGRRRQCKTCVCARVRAYRAGPEARAEFNRKSRAYYARREREARDVAVARQFSNVYVTQKGRALHMLNNARGRARRQGVAMTLTREWLLERLRAGVCEATGLPLTLKTGQGRGHDGSAFSPSIDRRAAGGDYTPENSRVVCWIFNRALGAFPEADFEQMCRAYLAAKETA